MGSSLRCEVGRKKHLGREGSAAFVSPSDSRDALFSRSACYSHRDPIRQLTAEAQLQRGAPHGPGPTAEPCGGSAFPAAGSPTGAGRVVLGACLRVPVSVVVHSPSPRCVPLLSLSESQVLSWTLSHRLADVWPQRCLSRGSFSSRQPSS